MKPARARYTKIERLVDSILEDFSVRRPPVPIEKILKKLKIELKHGNLGEVSGLLLRSGASATIGVNATQAPVRQRFTIAHELGHYLLHAGLLSHVDKDYRVNYRSAESSEATNVEEIEANFFAASILMPRQFLINENAVLALDNDAEVERLAKRFAVSRHAMSLRLANVYRLQSPFQG